MVWLAVMSYKMEFFEQKKEPWFSGSMKGLLLQSVDFLAVIQCGMAASLYWEKKIVGKEQNTKQAQHSDEQAWGSKCIVYYYFIACLCTAVNRNL
jgi:hypothetical protein